MTKVTKTCFLNIEDYWIEELRPYLSETHDIVSLPKVNDLMELLKTKSQQYVVVIGPTIENPVHLATAIHGLCHLVPIFIIAKPEKIEFITREFKFNPFANPQVSILTTHDWLKLPAAIDASIELSEELKTKMHELNSTKKYVLHPIPNNIWQQIQSLPFGVIISSTNGMIHYANDQIRLYLDISDAKHCQCSILDLFHKDEHLKLSYLILKATQQKCIEVPIIFSTRGSIKYFEVTAAINASQDNSYVFLFLNDISKQVDSELQLITKNIETQAIIDSIPSVILCVNNTGHIQYLNNLAESLFKTSHSRAKGTHVEELLPFMKKYPNIIAACLNERVTKTLEGITSEIFGSDQYIDIHFSPYCSHDVLGVAVKFDNITDRLAKIEDKVKMEKAISLACLSIGIAHSINNPLSGISIAITNIHNRLFKKDEHNIQLAKECGCDLDQIEAYMQKQLITKMHHDIIEQIERISIIIKNTLFFGSTSIQHPMGYYNINVIIKNAIHMVRLEKNVHKQLLFENINIVEQSNEKLLMVRCNHIELSLVMLHLLKNAGESLARVQHQNHNPTIHVRSYLQDQICYIEVEDNGDGIKVSNQERMFEPFFSTDCKLAGLGLAICHSIIVHHHKGKIYSKKKATSGAIFVIELPTTYHNDNE